MIRNVPGTLKFCQTLLEYLPVDRFLSALRAGEFPELVRVAEFNLLSVQLRHADQQCDGLARARQNGTAALSLPHAFLEVRFLDADDFHSTSSIVRLGGVFAGSARIGVMVFKRCILGILA